jgi:hypothetical protein
VDKEWKRRSNAEHFRLDRSQRENSADVFSRRDHLERGVTADTIHRDLLMISARVHYTNGTSLTKANGWRSLIAIDRCSRNRNLVETTVFNSIIEISANLHRRRSTRRIFGDIRSKGITSAGN